MRPAPFQAFPLRSREQSELILSAALLSSLTLFHVQLRGKCPHSEAKAPIIIENPGSICVRAGSGPRVGICRSGLFFVHFSCCIEAIYIYDVKVDFLFEINFGIFQDRIPPSVFS